MDLMIDRKELDNALQQILQGRNAQGPEVVDFTADRESLTVVVTGRSVEVDIEVTETGSVSVPIAVIAKLMKVCKTYEKEQVRLRATKGQVRLEGMSIANKGIRMRKIARRVIDIPQDARPMDLLGLPHIFTAIEIKDSELSAKVLQAEKKMAKRLDSASKDLADYEISRDELHALVESRIRDYIPSLRKAVLSE
jgi:hypothetical protein